MGEVFFFYAMFRIRHARISKNWPVASPCTIVAPCAMWLSVSCSCLEQCLGTLEMTTLCIMYNPRIMLHVYKMQWRHKRWCSVIPFSLTLQRVQGLATIYTGAAVSAILWDCLLCVHVLKEQSHNVPGRENGTSVPRPHQVYSGYGERARAQSTSGKVRM